MNHKDEKRIMVENAATRIVDMIGHTVLMNGHTVLMKTAFSGEAKEDCQENSERRGEHEHSKNNDNE